MAHPKRRLPDNAPGDFFVDDTCIDCDTCRWLAPETFFRAQGQSAVKTQPTGGIARERALQAVVACPTASIGTVDPAPEMPTVRASFPLPLDGEVFYCGYHSPKSFGAASYLLRRPDGNILVDSPRFSKTLADRIEALGGARWLFLTHGDDVADHEAWRERLGCDRILHAGDATRSTRAVEMLLEGEAPVDLAPDLRIVPVPGHTRGSCVLLASGRYLFTGDHLAWSIRLGHLYAFRDACWYSWKKQVESMRALRGIPFQWVLPGHGRRFEADPGAMEKQLETCIKWMESAGPIGGEADGD